MSETEFTPHVAPDWDKDIPLPDARDNMKTTFMHHVEYWGMRMTLASLRVFGYKRSSNIGASMARFIGPKLKSVHKRGLQNLRYVYPDKSEEEYEKILLEAWDCLGRIAGEMPFVNEMHNYISCEGIEHAKPLQQGQAAIIVTGHFANWDAICLSGRLFGLKYGFVYRPANNALIDKYIIDMRAKYMSRYQIPKGNKGGREIIKALKTGHTLALLTDQKLNEGISVPFLGKEAMTPPAAARMSLKLNVPILPMQPIRYLDDDGVPRFRMVAHPPIEFTPTGQMSDDVYALTKLVNDKLSSFVDEHPGQWLWFHRRWPKEVTRDL